jgi:Flp pilus assembly protein TadD
MIVLILVFAAGINTAFLVGPVARQVEAATGYRLRVDGLTKVVLRPSLAVIVENVGLVDPKDGGHEEFFSAERLRMGLSLPSLVKGNVHVTDVTVTRPILRVDFDRHVLDLQAAQKHSSPPRNVPVDRLRIDDGTLMFRDPQLKMKTLMEGVSLTALLAENSGLNLDGEATWGDDRVRISATTDGPARLADGRTVTSSLKFEVEGSPPPSTVSATSTLSYADQILKLDDLRGMIGNDPFTGRVSLDLARDKPYLRAELDFHRLRLGGTASAADGVKGSGQPTREAATWSDRPFDLTSLNLLDADAKVSSGELDIEKVRLAPVVVEAKLDGGRLKASVSSHLYEGEGTGSLDLDASGGEPHGAAQVEIADARALPLLRDAADFDHLDGRIHANFDLKTRGESLKGLVSTLGGKVGVSLENGSIRGVSLPKLVCQLTANPLEGWQENGADGTSLDSLTATFRLERGVATTSDLRVSGRIVRVTGAGSVDLLNKILDFKTDPKLVLNTGRPSGSEDPLGLGVPVIVRGPWSNPQIYPDVIDVLEHPDVAYATLAELGAGLFGVAKNQSGFSLESILGDIAGTAGDVGKRARDRPERPGACPDIAKPETAKMAAKDVGPPPADDTGAAQSAELRHRVADAGSPGRVALVIGNANYVDNEPLGQPVKDARAVANELRRFGFVVIPGENLTKQGMRTAIESFKSKIKSGSTALIFFSGFGIQSDKQSYIIPVDAQIWREEDVARDGTSLENILADLDSQGAGVKIAIIDASRKNPFERRFRRYSAGLASIDAPTGTLVISAAAPGRVGIEDRGGNSPFISELVKQMRSPGLSAEDIANRTRVGVSRASNNAQVPWVSSSLPDVFYFSAADAPVAEAPRVEADSAKPVRNNTKKTSPDTKEATAKLDDVIKRHPEDANAYYRRGQVYAENGDYGHAVADFNEAVRLNPRDPEARNNRCWARAVLGQLQAAITDCSEALRLKPDYADALDSRGFANLKLGNYLQAIADFDGALKSNPRQVSSLYGRGRAKLKSGDEAGGSADIKSAKALDPNIAEEFAGYGVPQ